MFAPYQDTTRHLVCPAGHLVLFTLAWLVAVPGDEGEGGSNRELFTAVASSSSFICLDNFDITRRRSTDISH